MLKRLFTSMLLIPILGMTLFAQDFPLIDSNLIPAPDTSYSEITESNEEEPEKEEDKTVFLTNRSAMADSFAQRRIPDSVISRLKAEDDFWYANKNLVRVSPKKTKSLGDMKWFQTLLWILVIAGFIGFLGWYLAGNQVGIFRKKRLLINEEPEAELVPENIFVINYQKEIDKAVRESNFRLAIRLLFLRLLKQLSEKNIIQYQQDKTNLDYLHQLNNSGYYKDFFQATRNYEYSWYGQFPVSEEAYKLIRKEFDRFDRILN